MIKVYIFADSHKHFQWAVHEYIKRLGKWVDLIELKPVKKWTPQQIIESETQILKDKLQKDDAYKVILSPKGNLLSTEKLWQLIQEQKNHWRKITFLIGWANWLDYWQLQDYVDIELSLSNMIFPHTLALTVLLEQIYRCNEIQKWTWYHK